MNDDISLAASSAVDSDSDHLLAVSEGQGCVNVNIGSDDDMASSCDNDSVSLQRSSEEMHGGCQLPDPGASGKVPSAPSLAADTVLITRTTRHRPTMSTDDDTQESGG